MLHFETIAPATLELLRNLQAVKGLEKARLVGGTGLALQIGHRQSVDLDLFAHNLEDDFLSIASAIRDKGYEVDIRQQSTKILVIMVNSVKVDIVNYPYPWLDNPVYDKDINLATMKDIAAMKLSAVTNRGTKKDFIDLYYLLNTYSLEEMLSFYNAKYFDSSSFLVIKSLAFFEDAEMEVMPQMFDKNINWEHVKNRITEEVNEII